MFASDHIRFTNSLIYLFKFVDYILIWSSTGESLKYCFDGILLTAKLSFIVVFILSKVSSTLEIGIFLWCSFFNFIYSLFLFAVFKIYKTESLNIIEFEFYL